MGLRAKVKLKVELVSQGSGIGHHILWGLGCSCCVLRQCSLVFRADVSQGPGV